MTTEREERLREALVEARSVLVVACGERAPYIKVALKHIDAALAAEPRQETAPRTLTQQQYRELILCADSLNDITLDREQRMTVLRGYVEALMQAAPASAEGGATGEHGAALEGTSVEGPQNCAVCGHPDGRLHQHPTSASTTTDTRTRAEQPPDEKLLSIVGSFIDVPATKPTKFNEFFHALEQYLHAHGLRQRLEEARWIDGNVFKVGKWKIDAEKLEQHIADLERELKEAEERSCRRPS